MKPELEQLEPRLILAATIWLDFDGDFQASWGGHTNITTPPWNGDRSAVVQYVREDFSPFNATVTATQPAVVDDSVLHVVVGGDGAWTGGLRGGISAVGSFTNPV